MEKFRFLKKEEVAKIPKTAGVYTFRGKGAFLYIGKASNLRERVRSHFQQPAYRDGFFINQVSKIGYIETDSEIEALILEAKLIKKFQPKYNIIWRDDKNYFYVGITKEDFPRIFITHQIKNQKFPITSRILDKVGTKIKNQKHKLKIKNIYIGPFVAGRELKQSLRIMRKIFPYYTVKKHPNSLCLWCHFQLCPGPKPDKKEYQKNIKNLISVLKGKRKMVLLSLKQEMEKSSLSQDYERAAKIRDRIAALEKIMFHAKVFTGPERKPEKQKELEKKLKKILKTEKPISRIEAYDVSNIQGNLATGSMITFIQGKPDKNFYRRFKIRISGLPNDVAMLKEVVARRFEHTEWPYPDLILVDGGKAQLNAALNVLNRHKSAKSALIGVLALAKKENKLFIEGRKKPILLKGLPREIFNLILQLRGEAHRFAISYHKKLRIRGLLK